MDESPTDLPALPKFTPDEKVCGNCKLWQPHSVDPRGWVGPCRLQPQRGLFPPSAPTCDAFAPRGVSAAVAPAASPRPQRRPRDVSPLVIRRGDGSPAPGAAGTSPRSFTPRPAAAATTPRRDPGELVDLLGGEQSMTREELMELFREAAGESIAPSLANKWEGGVIQLIPGNRELQTKELPIDALFHKVVMVRDRLRTLEQKLNAHPKLTDAEKVEMQHYITRVYGSLTSFNLLFRDRADQFVGSKAED